MKTMTVADDLDLRLVDEGVGDPPLLFLHGFPLRAEAWGHQVREFAGDHRVVVPDLRGFGRSGTSARRVDSVDPYASDVLRLIDDLGMDRVVVIGHDLAGYVALDVLRLFADRVGALVLVSAPFGPLPGEERRLDEQRSWLRGEEDREYFIDWVRDAIVAPESLDRAEVVKLVRVFARDASTDGLVDALTAMQHRTDVIPDLEKIDVPTLLLYGEHDRMVDRDQLQSWHATIRGSQLEVVPDGGHLPMMESPGWFNRHLADFLARL